MLTGHTDIDSREINTHLFRTQGGCKHEPSNSGPLRSEIVDHVEYIGRSPQHTETEEDIVPAGDIGLGRADRLHYCPGYPIEPEHGTYGEEKQQGVCYEQPAHSDPDRSQRGVQDRRGIVRQLRGSQGALSVDTQRLGIPGAQLLQTSCGVPGELWKDTMCSGCDISKGLDRPDRFTCPLEPIRLIELRRQSVPERSLLVGGGVVQRGAKLQVRLKCEPVAPLQKDGAKEIVDELVLYAGPMLCSPEHGQVRQRQALQYRIHLPPALAVRPAVRVEQALHRLTRTRQFVKSSARSRPRRSSTVTEILAPVGSTR